MYLSFNCSDNAQEVKPYPSPEDGYHSQSFNRSKLHFHDATNEGYEKDCELKENLHDNTVSVPTLAYDAVSENVTNIGQL